MSSARSDVPDFIRTQSGQPLFVNSVSFLSASATVLGFFYNTQDVGPQGVAVPLEDTQLLMLQPSVDCLVRLVTAGTVAGFATVTYAAESGAQTVTVNGVTVSFAATGIPATDAALAATLINANAALAKSVTATSAAGVTTITANYKGAGSNSYTLAVTGTGATASGANFTSGANPAAGTTATNSVYITANSQYWIYKLPNYVQLDLKGAAANGTMQIFAVV